MKAIQLLNNNLTPVLLGSSGDGLKKPIIPNWPELTTTADDARRYDDGRHNIGVRTGQQQNGQSLIVYDFDHDADAVFWPWLKQAQKSVKQPFVIVKTPGGGYHAYFLTSETTHSRKLAFSDKLNENGRPLVRIETRGQGGQVVSAGSLHPNGGRYAFLNSSLGYDSIPSITPEQNKQLDTLSRSFCLKPKPVVRQVKQASSQPARPGGYAKDCLDYAYKYIGGETKKERKTGDIRFLGNGGLLITANGRAWYCHGDDRGGGLVELVEWNEGITRQQAIDKLYPPAANFSLAPAQNGYDIVLNEGQFLGDVNPQLPSRAMLAANTGSGKTTYAVSIPGRVVLVVPTQALLEQLCSLHPAARPFYQFNRKIGEDDSLIITTPNSIQKLLPKVDASQYSLVIDEAHEFAVAGYRRRAYDDLAMCLGGSWANVILMTGTPFPLVWRDMEVYEPVTVSSPQRQQAARLVAWQDDKGKGSKLKTAVSLMPPAAKHKRIFIYLQDKKTALDSLIYELKQLGYERGEIAVLNADTRTEPGQDSDHYLHLMEHEQLPNQVQVVIATAVLMTGVNIKQRFDQVHLLTAVSSIEAQQIVNRFRLAAPGIVYDYSNNQATGDAAHFDVRWLASEITTQAQQTADHLTAKTATMTPEACALVEYERKAAQALLDAHIIQFVPEDDTTQEPAYYQPSPAGVTHEIFKRFKAAERHNPELYKNNLAAYGWQFGDDLRRVIVERDSGGRAAFVAECHEARQAKIKTLAQQLLGDGYTATTEAVKDSANQSSLFLRNAQFALVLHGDKTDGRPGLVDSWQLATDAILAAEDSAQKRNSLIRRLRIQQDRKQPLTAQIYGLFAVGERLTGDDIAERLMAFCEQNPTMALFTRKRWADHEPINAARAVRFVRDYFELKRGKVATADGRDNCYLFVDDCPHITENVRLDLWAAGEGGSVSLPCPTPHAPRSETATNQAANEPPPLDFELMGRLFTPTRRIMQQMAGTWATA